MADNVACPGCNAQLVLPSMSSGQTVQCPRCQQVFEPTRQRVSAAVPRSAPAAIVPADDSPDEAPTLRPPGQLRGEWKANAAMLLIGASVFFFAVEGYLGFEHIQLIKLQDELVGAPRRQPGFFVDIGPGRRAPKNPRLVDLERRWNAWEGWSEAAKMFHHLTYWPSAVIFLIWLLQASRNGRILQAEKIHHTPGEAVLSFFVPIWNLFRPYVIVQEIWRASHPRAIDTPLSWMQGGRSRVVQFWWAFHLAAAAFWVFSFVQSSNDFDMQTERASAVFMLLANLCVVAEGACLIAVIRSIKARQRERYENLCDAA